MDVLKFGFQYWKRSLLPSIITQCISFLSTISDLLLPLLLEILIDYVIGQQTPSKKGIFAFLLSGKYGEVHTMRLFWNVAIVYVGVLLFRLVAMYLKNVLFQNWGLRLETDLRKACFHKLLSLDSETISEYNTGELLTIINSDTIMFKELFGRRIPNVIDGFVALFISFFMLARIHISLLLIPIILAPIFGYQLMKFKKIAKKNYRKIREENSKMSLNVQENIEAVRLVRAFTNEEYEKHKFDNRNENLKQSHLTQIGLSAKFEASFSTIRQVAYISTIGISAFLVIRGYIAVGFLVACSNYIMKIMNYVTQISNNYFQLQQQVVSGQKMMNFLNCDSKVPDVSENKNDSKITERPNLKIEHATLELDGMLVLDDVSIDIPYGKKIGIVGGTGSGKSLLLEALVRNHELNQGKITMNEVDIKELSLHTLREQYSYVFQEAFLFSNTIDSNIAYAVPEVAKSEVESAAKCAMAHGFITELPMGYDTVVGERGLGISGGQKQRLSIARAILKDAPILVLDDSTSALDVETERMLLKNIETYCPEKTVLISAHRLTSVQTCDEIIYMQDGKIVERGTFEELMKLNGHFASVYQIQEVQRNSVVDYDTITAPEKGVI